MSKTKLLLVSAFALGVLVSISSCSDDEQKYMESMNKTALKIAQKH